MVKADEKTLVGVRRQITMPEDVSKAVGLEPGKAVRVRQTGPDTLEIKVLPRLTFEEWLERYRVDEPVDIKKLFAEAEQAEADEYLRKMQNGHE